jgi:nucleoside phosphorylase
MPATLHGRVLLLTCAIVAVLAAPAAAAPRRGLCATIADPERTAPYLAVLSAFPAELAPLVARTTIREQVEFNAQPFYVGELAGVRVVLGLLGIGMVNAAASTENLLANFDVAAILVSGVAGSPRRIGDVIVPPHWEEPATGVFYPADPVLVKLARLVATEAVFERCTRVPPPDGDTVCLAHEPEIVVDGLGESEDPFRGRPFPCLEENDPVFGCALPAPAAALPIPGELLAVDMESAAVARVAAVAQVPFVAFRAVSDGAGDPLDLPGFPAQFFAYYPLAAANAAGATAAVVERIAGFRGRGRLCRLLARERTQRAARLLR